MGYIRKNFGRAHTESRSESFYFSVHYNKDGCCGKKNNDPLPTLYAEIAYDELNDMILSLTDLRDNDERYKGWRASLKLGKDGRWRDPKGRLLPWPRASKHEDTKCDTRYGCGGYDCPVIIGA